MTKTDRNGGLTARDLESLRANLMKVRDENLADLELPGPRSAPWWTTGRLAAPRCARTWRTLSTWSRTRRRSSR